MTLHWEGAIWAQSLDMFEEGTRNIQYGEAAVGWPHHAGGIDWVKIGMEYAAGRQPDWGNVA